MPLPTEKTAPINNVERKSILLYGRSKIGKSTWASKIPNAVFLVTDPGLDEIAAFKVPAEGVMKSWKELLEACREIAEGKHPFKTIIIDSIDIAYQLCCQQICEDHQEKFWTDGDLAYGKGPAKIRNEMYRMLLKLCQLPYGLVLISHSMEKTFEDAQGKERKMMVPSLPEKAGEIVLGLVDAILYADIDMKATPTGPVYERVIRLRSTQSFQAGVRGGSHLPSTWSLSDYEGFMAAWKESLQVASADGTKKPVVPAKKG
jgi:hypothetical protein